MSKQELTDEIGKAVYYKTNEGLRVLDHDRVIELVNKHIPEDSVVVKLKDLEMMLNEPCECNIDEHCKYCGAAMRIQGQIAAQTGEE